MGNVLKDWAFRKPLPEEVGTKRLGIEQPDHHTSWLNFEGTIEDGYGAGTLKIWDKGKINDFNVKENQKFVGTFVGKRVKGKYVLVRSDKLNGWLFWKTG